MAVDNILLHLMSVLLQSLTHRFVLSDPWDAVKLGRYMITRTGVRAVGATSEVEHNVRRGEKRRLCDVYAGRLESAVPTFLATSRG